LRHYKDFKILARCGNGEEALLAVRKHRPAVLLLDCVFRSKSATHSDANRPPVPKQIGHGYGANRPPPLGRLN